MPDLISIVAAKLHELTLKNGGESRGAADMRDDATTLIETIAEAGASILWRPVADMPYTLKGTGADFLLWSGGEAVIGYWSDSGQQAGNWVSRDDDVLSPTHYVRLSSPE